MVPQVPWGWFIRLSYGSMGFFGFPLIFSGILRVCSFGFLMMHWASLGFHKLMIFSKVHELPLVGLVSALR